jgi:hypothetical protein
LDPTPKMRTENGEEEMEEQIEPPPILNWSNDKEVSTEAHSFVTIPLETYHSPQVSSFQCLEEPSYVEIFLKNFYIRWWNILPEGYHILKKKGWKGLVGHPYECGRCGTFSFLFFALHFLFILFYFLLFYFYLFQFLTAINFLMFVLVKKNIYILLLVFDRCVDVQVWGMP